MSPSGFWRLQGWGWLLFAVAMTFSRIGTFPLRFMVASKGILAALGFLCSLVLWRIYRRLPADTVPLARIVVTCVAASFALALVWTAAANLLDVPLYAALLDRPVTIGSVGRLFSGSVYHTFALLAWSLGYFVITHHTALADARERTLRAEMLAQQARLEALRFQINPHFLFNTLNAISTLVVEQRHADASRMIARLSDFLRLTLGDTASDDATVDDEIDFATRYLEIEQVRFGDRLETRFDIDESVRHARVPALILQPLIENAVRHGVLAREGKGTIAISARRHGDTLRLTVANDGAVPAPAAAERSERRGIGLANTSERLQQAYGARADFALRRAEGGGTVAEITLPLDGRSVAARGAS